MLTAISQKSPVPHLVVIDHDERSKAEVTALQTSLADKVHLLRRREMENYLLVPRAIIAALSDKYADNDVVLDGVQAATPDSIQSMIERVAASLFGIVLLKRIRSELGGLEGGLLSRAMLPELVGRANHADLARHIIGRIQARVADCLSKADIARMVEEQKVALLEEWSDEERRLELAPGEEIISAIYASVGGTYEKPSDTVRIAKRLQVDEIDQEIVQLIERAVRLTKRGD